MSLENYKLPVTCKGCRFIIKYFDDYNRYLCDKSKINEPTECPYVFISNEQHAKFVNGVVDIVVDMEIKNKGNYSILDIEREVKKLYSLIDVIY